MRIACTTLSSKLLTHEKEHFAKLAVDAVMRLKGSNNLDCIPILQMSGGQLKYLYLEEGFLLDKSAGVDQLRRVENAKVLIDNISMDTDKIKIYGSHVRVNSMNKVAEIEEAEKTKMHQKCDKSWHMAIMFSSIGKNGIMAIEHSNFDGVECLAAVTNGEI
eukprot:1818802-Ditylum_brightwellii.AAC.1